MAPNLDTLDFVLDGLMLRYKNRVPDVDRVISALVRDKFIPVESAIENDHIAFRTMGVAQLGIASLERIFITLGYQRRDFYNFEGKKLNAYWYSPPTPRHPRIFISELRVKDLSPKAQQIITSYTDEVTSDPVSTLNFDKPESIDQFLHSPLWRLPTWEDYSNLLAESEYAAWVIYNRYYLNHFTISVHNLPDEISTVNRFNQYLERIGIVLNDAGGKAKKSPDGLLIQSSTVAQTVMAEFRLPDGGTIKHKIAGSYVEFAERRVLPQFKDLPATQIRREHRRDGFEAQNADKIFESTYSSQLLRGEKTGEKDC